MDIGKLQKSINALPWLAFLILTRLLPHPPNTAPIFCAAIALSYFFSKNQVVTLGLIAFILSDIALGFINHFPIFGLWSFFTYSGFIAALILGTAFPITTSHRLHAFYAVVSSTFFFWVWTNFGTWLTTPLYPKTVAGLLACFIAGIPFLSNSLLGNLAWGIVVFTPLFLYKKSWERQQSV